MTKTIHSWAIDRPISSPFAFPEGWLGSLAGRLMLAQTDEEVFDLLAFAPGQRVLEVGFGAGGLLARLDEAGASLVVGVDPSPRMLRDASARNAASLRAGRMILRAGTAAATGSEPDRFHRAIAVHNVALWPDLDEGIRELRRVLRDDGALVLAWHGGRNPPWTTKNLRLPPDKLDRIEQSLAAQFASVERFATARDDVFRAWA